MSDRLNLPRNCYKLVLVSKTLFVALSTIILFQSTTFAQSKPNIVVIYSDDAGYADFGFQNALSGQTTEFLTPNLDTLAQQGIRFSSGYVTASVCSPSRAGLLTGRYQQRFGYEHNIANANNAEDGMPTDQVMMTARFQELGYTTGVVGKWHLGREVAKQPQNRGVDEFYGLWRGSRPYFGINSDVTRKIRDENGPRDWVNEASFNNIPVDSAGKGRHVTDAFGDEASRFVANHAGDAEPFFLYMPFTAPHGPLTLAKQQDLDQFDGTSLTGERKTTAALVLAMDRAVGNILSRLDDPNGDGDTSDSVANNTIVVFANDNGGTSSHDNGVLRGNKGNAYEGGIRVPFLIRMPDPDNPGQFLTGNYDRPVSTFDLFATFMGAAGESMTTPTDGVDLTPYLTGEQTGDPHEILVWRKDSWAIRKGDWKLVKGTGSDPIMLTELAADGTGEFTDLSAANPEKYQELIRDFTAWETQMAKPSQSTSRTANRFDHFRFRQGAGTSLNWSDANVWNRESSSTNVTMIREDAYANAILEFYPKNNDSFVATNDMTRSSTLTFMLNELRFGGNFSGSADQVGTINGNDLLFVKNLNGEGPKIQLASNSSSSTGDFTFNIDTNLILFDDLLITGDSERTFNINGVISDFYESRGVTKNGTSRVTLTGANTYFGATTIIGGTLALGSGASLASPLIDVQAGGTLDASQIAGGLDISGKTLQGSGDVQGNLVIGTDGVHAPGNSPGIQTVNGDYFLNGGTLEIELDGLMLGTEYDQVDINGSVDLAGGILDVQLGFLPTELDEFTIIDNNEFDLVTGLLSVDGITINEGETFERFFDNNEVTFGLSYIANGNDVVISVSSIRSVPEPSTFVLGMMVVVGFCTKRRRC